MTNLSRNKLFTTGKVLVKEEKSKSFIKQVATINNQYLDLKIINAMVEQNIFINIVDNSIKQSYIQKLQAKSKQLQIRIVLKGCLEKLNHKTNEKTIYNENEISVEYNEALEESLLNKQGEHVKYVCITLNEDYLNENNFLEEFYQKPINKKFYEPSITDRFEELFVREYSSGLDQIYLKNKTMEVILYVLEELQQNKQEKIEGLNQEDIKRVKKVYELINNSFDQKLTIDRLSKEVALNQTKLKKGFKALYKQTVHDYLKDVRLKKAVEYLKEDSYSIKEISQMVGYTNQSSFSYAFSNKYECSPKEIQKNSNF